MKSKQRTSQVRRSPTFIADREIEKEAKKAARERAAAASAAWNKFGEKFGSFSDEYSTL